MATYLIEVLSHARFARVVMARPLPPGVRMAFVLVASGRALPEAALTDFAAAPGAFVVRDPARDLDAVVRHVRPDDAGEDARGLLLAHGLTPAQAAVAMQLHERLACALAYFCYGGELYARLSARGRLRLYDRHALRRRAYDLAVLARESWRWGPAWPDLTVDRDSQRFLRAVDILATPLAHDRRYLGELRGAPVAAHVDYLYPVDEAVFATSPPAERPLVFLNHSASRTGNHAHVIDRLAGAGVLGARTLVVPLSYGNPRRRREVERALATLPAARVRVLDEYLAPADYVRLCSSAAAAVYGHRRQEAVGNVMIMLALGVRVYLRAANPLLSDLRGLGFAVSSIEDDLDAHGFSPLDDAAATANRALVRRYASRAAWLAAYERLLTFAA